MKKTEKEVMRPTNNLDELYPDKGKISKLRKNDSFKIIGIEIDPENNERDSFFVNRYLEKAKTLGTNIKNPSGEKRSPEELLKTRYLGIASEELLTCLLKKELGGSIKVDNPEFISYEDHVDIIISDNEKKITIELRGSYPKASLKNVIWYYFDLIGPYTTSYKSKEDHKDYYLRTFINEPQEQFDPLKKHTIYFSGGAPIEYLLKNGITENFKMNQAKYLTIKPLADAFDMDEILEKLKLEFTIK